MRILISDLLVSLSMSKKKKESKERIEDKAGTIVAHIIKICVFPEQYHLVWAKEIATRFKEIIPLRKIKKMEDVSESEIYKWLKDDSAEDIKDIEGYLDFAQADFGKNLGLKAEEEKLVCTNLMPIVLKVFKTGSSKICKKGFQPEEFKFDIIDICKEYKH